MTKQLITRSMAFIPERNFYRFQGLQTLVFMTGLRTAASSMLACFGHSEIADPLELSPITKVYLCPEGIVMPYNKPYILIAFDYERYNTSSFKEKISLN